MNTTYSRLIARAVVMAAFSVSLLRPAVGRAEASAQRPDVWATFKVIVERNMFSRQRGAAERRQRQTEERPVAVPDPESYCRLRGIAQENGTFVAFVEDTRSGETLKLRQGDSVARGSIESLDLDSIVYRLEDRTITVAIGQDLLGGRGAVTMTELMEWTPLPSTSPSGAPTTPAAPSGDEADILRQLMERRKQELGQ